MRGRVTRPGVERGPPGAGAGAGRIATLKVYTLQRSQ